MSSNVDRLVGAAKHGYLNVATALIRGGTNVNDEGSDGMTPMLQAAGSYQLGSVEMLLKHGADPNKARSDNGCTPLISAIDVGIDVIDGAPQSIVKALIAAGANVNQPMDGQSPLFFAAENGVVWAVKLLLEAGADVNQGDANTDTTPLAIAASNGHQEVVNILIEAGAQTD